MNLLITIALVAILATSTVQAKIYKWVDENGEVHFTQTPPPEKFSSSEEVKVQGAVDKTKYNYTREQLTPFCEAVSDITFDLADKMNRGYSANQALTSFHSNSLEALIKSQVSFVWRFQGTNTPSSQIVSLTDNQCYSGSFSKYVYDYLKVEHPDLITDNEGNSTESPSFKRSGTAWLVADGIIATNYHVIGNAQQGKIKLRNGSDVIVSVIATDKDNDLALLKLKSYGDYSNYLPLAAEEEAPGSEVFTMGYPHISIMGSSQKVTEGIISSTSGLHDDNRFYQISVPVQSGNSGGPLINMKGEVVGIVTSKLNALALFKNSGDLPQNVNYAIKTHALEKLLKKQWLKPKDNNKVTANSTIKDIVSDYQNSVFIVYID